MLTTLPMEDYIYCHPTSMRHRSPVNSIISIQPTDQRSPAQGIESGPAIPYCRFPTPVEETFHLPYYPFPENTYFCTGTYGGTNHTYDTDILWDEKQQPFRPILWAGKEGRGRKEDSPL
jgi:hypothetical protein